MFDSCTLDALVIHSIIAIIRKDLLIELRARESLAAMIVFALMTLVMANFALRLRADSLRPLAPGILWITLVFAGTLGLSRTMFSEQLNNAIDGLLLAPHDRSVIFVSKAVTNALFMLVAALVALPVVAALFDDRMLNLGVLACVALGVVGYSGVGTLIAAIALSTRAREVFLPILLLPLALPLVVVAVISTSGFVDSVAFGEFGSWLGVLVGFIVMFWTAGIFFFDYLVEG